MEKTGKEASARRIYEFDLLRGIAVILMMFDHLMYDLFSLMPLLFRDFPGKSPVALWLVRTARSYWYWPPREGARVFVICLFLFLTGICCHFSKSNLRRGGRLLLVSLLVSLGTLLVGWVGGDLDFLIAFGILHCIALSLLFVGLIEHIPPLNSRWVFLGLGLLFTAVGLWLNTGLVYVSYYDAPFLEILFEQMIGTVYAGSDSCGLLLYGGPILLGVFCGRCLYKERKPRIFKRYRESLVTRIGRQSLLFYVAHQIIFPLVLGGILLLFGYHLSL